MKTKWSETISNGIKKKMENDPVFKKQWIEKCKLGRKRQQEIYGCLLTFEDRSKGGKIGWKKSNTALMEGAKNSRKYENAVAENIKTDYEFFLHGYSICDRVGFKNGTIYFIEIKRKNRKQNPRQKMFQELVQKAKKFKYVIVHDSQ